MSEKLTFAEWWGATGSEIRPLIDADFESHANRISEAAWIACRAEYLGRIIELEAQQKAVCNIGYETHESWGCNKEFNAGWKACREQIDDSIAELEAGE
jgi:hypothetical protein